MTSSVTVVSPSVQEKALWSPTTNPESMAALMDEANTLAEIFVLNDG
jgi:hypothetical protein